MSGLSEQKESKAPWPNQLLFWLGGVYLFALLVAMTPETNQLDDAKMLVLHILGPSLTVVYLLLVTFGKIRPPHIGIILTLLAYIFMVGLSMMFADEIVTPKAQQGLTMQMALLGAFFCFLGALDHPAMYRRSVLLVIAVGFFILAGGYFHRGLPGGRSTVLAIFENIEFVRNSKMREATELSVLLQEARNNPVQRMELSQEIKVLVSENSRIFGSFWRRLLNTLQGARGTMMSFIMNRNFLAAFVLFLMPSMFAGLFLLKGLSGKWMAGIVAGIFVVCWGLDSRYTIFSNSLPLWFLELLGVAGLLCLLWHFTSHKLSPRGLIAAMGGSILILAMAMRYLPSLWFGLLFGAAISGFALYFFPAPKARVGIGLTLLIAVLSLFSFIGSGQTRFSASEIKDVQGVAQIIARGEQNEASLLERRAWSFLDANQVATIKNLAQSPNPGAEDKERVAALLNSLMEIKQLSKAGMAELNINYRKPFSEWSVQTSHAINRKVLEGMVGDTVARQGLDLHGFWFLMLALAGASAFLLTPSFSYRLLFIGGFVLLGLMLYLAESFVANYLLVEIQMVLGFFLFLLAVRMEKRKALRLVVLLIACGAIGGALFLASPAGEKILPVMAQDMGASVLNDRMNAAISRQIIWEGAIDIWKQHPIIGAGPMSFMSYFPYFRRPDYFLFEISHVTIFAHNLFLDVLAETGILGFICFVSFLGYLFWRAMRTIITSPDRTRRLALAGIFLGALGFLLSNLTDPNARWPICGGLIWAAFGMVAGLVNSPYAPERAERWNWAIFRTPVHRVLMYCLIGFAVFFTIFSSWWSINYFHAALLNHNGLEFMNISEANLKNMNDLREAIQKLPEDSDERQRLVSRWNETGKKYNDSRLRAMQYFESAFEKSPLFVTSYYKLGSLYARSDQRSGPENDDLKESIIIYETLRQYAPEFAQVRWNLARVTGRLSALVPEDESEATPFQTTTARMSGAEGVNFSKDWLITQSMEHHRIAAMQTINTQANQYYIGFMIEQGGNMPDTGFQSYNISDAGEVGRRLTSGKEKAARKITSAARPADLERLKAAYQDYRRSTPDAAKQNYRDLQEAVLLVLKTASADPNLYDSDAFAEVEMSEHLAFLLRLKLTGVRLRKRNEILIAETLQRDFRRYPIKDYYLRNIRLHPFEEAIMEAQADYSRWREILKKDLPVRPAWDNNSRSLEQVVIDASMLYIEALLAAQWTEEAQAVVDEMMELIPGNTQLVEANDRLGEMLSTGTLPTLP